MTSWSNHRFMRRFSIYLIGICLASIGCQRVAPVETGAIVEQTEKTKKTVAELDDYFGWPDFDWKQLKNSNGFYYYSDSEYESKNLIDVSEHQKIIDWEKVRDAGVDSCIIRLGARYYGSGNLKYDKCFETNYREAQDSGLSVYGVYFFSQAIDIAEAEEEADFVIKKLKKISVSQDVIVFYNLESSEKDNYRNYRLSDEEIGIIMDTFAEKIKNAGYVPAVYTNGKWGDRQLDISIFSEYGIWYARHNSKPDLDSGFFLWQYSNEGKISGISTVVDLNLLFIKK